MNVIQKMRINGLARLFYKMQGYNVEEGYDFSKARHPQERAMWEFAKVSQTFWSMSKVEPTPKKKRRKMSEISEDIKKNNQKVKKTCGDCGIYNETTKDRPCPFEADVHGREVIVRICDDCEHERGMNI